ncbi:hypothetical protein [Streptosporangium sp. NPDC002524]|uniref:hypothetical protein n=1 Tax=Streptosporangium sp. NPDC002524 TaxID=3154537 RepID=UPI003331F8A9
MSAVGAGVLVLGASGVYAVQMDGQAAPPLDLAAAADSGTWAPGSRADRTITWAPGSRAGRAIASAPGSRAGRAIRFRIRLQGPGADARLAVLTTPAEALAGIECPEETRSSAPVPKGAGVCVIGALPAQGGSVDVLLAVPRHPRDVTVTALARMSGPDGETVRQQAQSTIRSSDAAMRPGGGVAGGLETLEHARAAREDRSAIDRAVGAPGAASMVLRVPQTAGEAGGAPLAAPGSPEAVEAAEARRAEERTSAFLLDLLGKAFVPPPARPGAAGTEANGAAALPVPATSALPAGPRVPPRAAAQGSPRSGALPGRALPGQGLPGRVPPGQTIPGQTVPGQTIPGQTVPGQAVPGQALPGDAGATGGPADSHETRITAQGGRQEAGSTAAAPVAPAPVRVPGAATVPAPARGPGAASAPGRPAGPVTPGLPPEGARLPGGTMLPDGVAAPGIAPGAGAGVPGQGQVAVPPAGVPAPLALQGQNGRNHSAVESQAGHKAAGRKAREQRHAAGRPGARGQKGRSALRHAGPGQPGVAQPGVGLPMTGLPGMPGVPGTPGMPGVPQPVPGQAGLQALGPVQPGGGRKAGRPGARRPVVGPMVPGYPGVVRQPAVPGQGVGRPMMPGYPGIGQPGMAPGMGQPAMPQAGAGGPMGAPLPPAQPGVPQPGAGQPGMPPGGAPAPGMPPGGPQLPGAGIPGAQGPGMPPASMGMAGAGQMPGLVNGLQLPQAGAFPAAQVPLQDPRPQGAPLPQDLDGPNGQVQPVAESSPLLTGVTGLPAVGAGVGTLLGLLWLQRRIQRRRRSRHVL